MFKALYLLIINFQNFSKKLKQILDKYSTLYSIIV